MHKIYCMPNLNLPQKIDLDAIRNELKQENAVEASQADEITDYESDDNDIDKIKQPKPCYILPLCKRPDKELLRQLSLKHNEYLALKFDKYLTIAGPCTVNVRLFHELTAQRSAPKPRRMKLNGKFYDVDNKLAPAPYFPDPRQYCKLNNCKKIKQN